MSCGLLHANGLRQRGGLAPRRRRRECASGSIPA
jgi:hypothetical protein